MPLPPIAERLVEQLADELVRAISEEVRRRLPEALGLKEPARPKMITRAKPKRLTWFEQGQQAAEQWVREQDEAKVPLLKMQSIASSLISGGHKFTDWWRTFAPIGLLRPGGNMRRELWAFEGGFKTKLKELVLGTRFRGHGLS